jgi:hypothetical protein
MQLRKPLRLELLELIRQVSIIPHFSRTNRLPLFHVTPLCTCVSSALTSLLMPGSSGAGDLAVNHLLGAAGFHVDCIEDGQQHIEVGRAASVSGHLHPIAVGNRGNLHSFGDPTGSAVLRLHDVGAPARCSFHPIRSKSGFVWGRNEAPTNSSM